MNIATQYINYSQFLFKTTNMHTRTVNKQYKRYSVLSTAFNAAIMQLFRDERLTIEMKFEYQKFRSKFDWKFKI